MLLTGRLQYDWTETTQFILDFVLVGFYSDIFASVFTLTTKKFTLIQFVLQKIGIKALTRSMLEPGSVKDFKGVVTH